MSRGEEQTQVQAAYREYLLQSTLPIIGTSGAERWIHGTGNLYRIGDRDLLVTAGHVARDFDRVHPHFPIDSRGKEVCPLNCSGGLVDTQLVPNIPDVAVLELSDDALPYLEGRRFLGLTDVYRGERSLNAVFLCGYPAELHTDLSDPNWVDKARVFVTNRYEGSTDGLVRDGLPSPPAHFEYSELLTYAENFPALAGMSGCAAWVPNCEARPPGSLFAPERELKVLGIQVGVFRRRQIIEVAGWGGIAQLMVMAFPDVREEIEAVAGKPFSTGED